ncbi:hypothetical protein ON010_g86 [Phytophthora cinnamomi]|nr:hypothetical protein ON010_g86 [Phytophthora cinnamomi]
MPSWLNSPSTLMFGFITQFKPFLTHQATSHDGNRQHSYPERLQVASPTARRKREKDSAPRKIPTKGAFVAYVKENPTSTQNTHICSKFIFASAHILRDGRRVLRIHRTDLSAPETDERLKVCKTLIKMTAPIPITKSVTSGSMITNTAEVVNPDSVNTPMPDSASPKRRIISTNPGTNLAQIAKPGDIDAEAAHKQKKRKTNT